MDNQPDNLMASDDSAIAQPFSVGAALREARDQLGLSVADVANRIKFAPRQIEALEADDFAHLPEAAFVRGFVRSYARLLEIDASPLLAGLPQTHLQAAAAPENKSVEVPFPSVLTSRRSNIAWLAGGLVVAVVLIIFSRLHDSSPDSVQPSVQTRVETLELPAAAIAAVSAPAADVSPAVPAAEAPKPIAPAAAAKMQVAQSSDKSANDRAELAAKKQTAKELAAQEQAAKELAAKEKIAKRQAALEQAAQEQAAKKQAAKELAAKEQAAKELAAKEKIAKRQAALEQAAQEKAAKKQAVQAQAVQKPSDAASEPASLRLEFAEDSWVDVKDASGKILLSRMNHAGSLVRLSGTAPLSVVIGHASGVHLFYRGKEVDLAPHTSVEVARLLLE